MGTLALVFQSKEKCCTTQDLHREKIAIASRSIRHRGRSLPKVLNCAYSVSFDPVVRFFGSHSANSYDMAPRRHLVSGLARIILKYYRNWQRNRRQFGVCCYRAILQVQPNATQDHIMFFSVLCTKWMSMGRTTLTKGEKWQVQVEFCLADVIRFI